MIEEKVMYDPQIQPNDSIAISPLACVDPSAKLGIGVTIGPWSFIGPNVEIGANSEIGSHVVIARDTKMGCNNKIYPFSAVGSDPQDVAYAGEQTFLEIGDNNIIRENVTISRGSHHAEGVTKIGNSNHILACSHVAHDCVVGNHILFVNHATLAGHVTVDDHAIIGAFSAVHQFCRVGSYSFLSHSAEITQDVPPFLIMYSSDPTPKCLNIVGLKRANFSSEAISHIKKAYKTLYRKGLKLSEAVEQLKPLAEESPEVAMMLDIITKTKRGIVR